MSLKKITKVINGKEIEGLVFRSGSTLWAHIDGRVITFEPAQSSNRKSGAVDKDPTKIVAPMPGKIAKIFFKNGDAVKSGDVVVVMEAMKMEYSLKATMDGKIKNLKAKAGDQADLGDFLAEIED